MIKRMVFVCLLAILSFSNCKKNTNTETGAFIGCYRASDQLIPYPYFLILKERKAILIDHAGNKLVSDPSHGTFKTLFA